MLSEFFLIQEGTGPLNLYVEDEFCRASRGGVGGVKSITNYAPVNKQTVNLFMSFILSVNSQFNYVILFEICRF